MPITLQSLEVVVAGRFNPHIITPDWLKKEAICHADAQVEMNFHIGPPGMSFHFEIDGFKWQVSDRHLRILTPSPERNPARRAADVLRVLCHTPIAGVGHNCVFRGDISDWQGGIPALGNMNWNELESHGTPQTVNWSCAIEIGGAVFNMTIEQTLQSVQINTNLHRDASNIDQLETTTANFESDIALSNELVGTITGDKVVHDD